MLNFLTFSPSSSHNFPLPAEEGVALHGLVLVDGDEGEHVGEELVSTAVGDPGQCSVMVSGDQWEESLTRDILAI